MEKASKTNLVPALRFPEFAEDEQWAEKELTEVCEINPENDELPDSFIYIDLESVDGGALKAKRRIEKHDAPSRAQRLLKNGDVIFQVVRPYQRNNLLVRSIGDEPHVASTGYAQLRAAGSETYLYQVVHTDDFVERVIAKCTGSGYPAINSSDLAAVPLPIPPTVGEQKKIADCLTSLDEVIFAQTRKVEALKSYKNALKQLLFPLAGETNPRLRFPEFLGAPEWVMRELGPMTEKVGSGITPLGGDRNYRAQGRPFVRSQNVGWGDLLLSDVAYIDEETHRAFDGTEIRKNDVLLNITGASIGRSAVADSRVVGGNVNQHVCIIRTKADELDPVLLNQFLISELGQKQIDAFQAGGNRQGLNFAQIRSFEIPISSDEREQRRVADCLSALDAAVVAEARELDGLQTLKKGLMQQLFPSLQDAT